MNVPKGNAVALQALKPIENKTADILSGYVFELIKQKKADDAARLKALADKGAAVDEVISKMDLKIDATLPQFQEGLNQFGKSYFDKKYEAERLRGDYSPEAQAKKDKLILEANKIKSDYELAKGFYANPEINTKIKEAQKAIAENKLYKGGKSYSSFLAVMGAPSVAGEENGNFGLYHYEQGADKPIKDNKTVFTPVGDLYNNILGLEEDTSPTTWTELDKLNATTSTRSDTGFVSRETIKLKEQAVRKSVRDLLGIDNTKPLDEQFESVSELPKKTKHLYYDLYKKEPQSKEDFKGFEDKILNRIKAKTNESDRVDVSLQSNNASSGNSSGSSKYEILTGGNVVRKMPEGGTIEVKNAVVVDLKDKGQIMGIKVPNKDKKGYHIEYAILGKDKFGRSAYERLTQKSDAVARLMSQKLDPNLFESLVMKQNEAEYTAKDKKNSIGTIKYYNASTSSDSQSDEEDPNMK